MFRNPKKKPTRTWHRPHFTYTRFNVSLYVSVINATMLCRWVSDIRVGQVNARANNKHNTARVGSWHYSHFPFLFLRFNAKIEIASKRRQSLLVITKSQYDMAGQLHSVRLFGWIGSLLLFACACVQLLHHTRTIDSHNSSPCHPTIQRPNFLISYF